MSLPSRIFDLAFTSCILGRALHHAVKPSLCQPAHLRHFSVTRPFPKSVFFPSQVELVCSSETAWRGTSRRSGAAICARLGSRVIGSLQQKIGGSNSRGLQFSNTDSYHIADSFQWFTFGACGSLARVECFTADLACHPRCDAAPPARQGHAPCHRAHIHPLIRRLRRSFAGRAAKLNENCFRAARGRHSTCIVPEAAGGVGAARVHGLRSR